MLRLLWLRPRLHGAGRCDGADGRDPEPVVRAAVGGAYTPPFAGGG
jgi:hypothetical protein